MDMARLRPKDVPKVRDEFVRVWGETQEIDLRGTYLDGWTLEKHLGWSYQPGGLDGTPMWFVSRDMVALAQDAAATIDPDDALWEVDGNRGYRVGEFDSGFAAFEGGLRLENVDPYGAGVTIDAVYWYNYKGDLAIITRSVRGDILGYAIDAADGGGMSTCSNMDWKGSYRPRREMGRFLTAMWSLSRTPTTATTATKTVPGAKIKGQRRRQAPAEVKIVELRQMKHQTVTHSPSGRQYHHRWVVRGHWRDQACGPGLKQRRRVWVPPYTKGPDGAPLLERPTVFAWRR